MKRSPADSTNRSLAAFGKLQHIPQNKPTHRLLIWNRDRHPAAARPQSVLVSVG